MAAPHFASRRSAVISPPGTGQIACNQPLAAAAGVQILTRGGNALDAAVAAAAAMAVLEPCSNGIGGDAFVLYYDAASRRVHGLNGSGRCAAALTRDIAAATPGATIAGLPDRHAHTVTVPGAVAAWCDAMRAWGSGAVTLADALAPAIALADRGFPVAPLTAHYWGLGVPHLIAHAHGDATAPEELTLPPECDAASAAATASGARRGPRPGELFANPTLAATLREIARDGAAAYYGSGGRIARAIVGAVAAAGGVLSLADLEAHRSTFVEPISTVYRGVRVFECPPNGQGLVALMALNYLEAMRGAGVPTTAPRPTAPWVSPPDLPVREPTGSGGGSGGAAAVPSHGAGATPSPDISFVDELHAEMEALRLAFADARAFIADPEHVEVPTAELLSLAYARRRVTGLRRDRACADIVAGRPTASSGTISLVVVDGRGNAASLIQSNYMGFGSGIIPRGCGFSLQNRGANFSLVPTAANVLSPCARPYHTIIPGLAIWDDDGSLFGPFSVMGGFMQPQGHAQLLRHLIDRGMDPQTALDMPRFCITDGKPDSSIAVEEGISEAVVAELRARGHAIGAAHVEGYHRAMFGRGQAIIRERATGTLWGGSDGRGDGCVMCALPPSE